MVLTIATSPLPHLNRVHCLHLLQTGVIPRTVWQSRIKWFVCSTWPWSGLESTPLLWSRFHLKFAQDWKWCQHLGVDTKWHWHQKHKNCTRFGQIKSTKLGYFCSILWRSGQWVGGGNWTQTLEMRQGRLREISRQDWTLEGGTFLGLVRWIHSFKYVNDLIGLKFSVLHKGY